MDKTELEKILTDHGIDYITYKGGKTVQLSQFVDTLLSWHSQAAAERERLARIDELEGLSVSVDDQCYEEWKARLEALSPKEGTE